MWCYVVFAVLHLEMLILISGVRCWVCILSEYSLPSTFYFIFLNHQLTIIMHWIVCSPPRLVEAATPGTCECDLIWKGRGWYNQVKVSSFRRPKSKATGVPCKEGGATWCQRHTAKAMWPRQRRSDTAASQGAVWPPAEGRTGQGRAVPSTSAGARPCRHPCFRLPAPRAVRGYISDVPWLPVCGPLSQQPRKRTQGPLPGLGYFIRKVARWWL